MSTAIPLRLTPDSDPVEITGEFGNLSAAEPIDAQPSHTGGAVEVAVEAAMADPRGLPPLSQCLTEDDQVAIALGAGVPQAVAGVRGVLLGLAVASIQPEQVTVVVAAKHDHTALADGLAEAIAAGLKIITHDPDDEENLCFTGVDKQDAPLRVNRQLFEADVVLPLTCSHAPQHPDAHGAYGDIYPTFGDRDAIKRSATSRAAASRDGDAAHAGWQLGAPIAIQIVPGHAGGVASVLAGETQQVQREATELSHRLWNRSCPEPTSLIVATLSGEPEMQNWRSVGRALEAAGTLAAPGAAVALLTQITSAPPEALIELADADDPERALKRIGKRHPADAPLARQVANALERGPLYLMSRMSEDDVESLGMAPLADADELQRLVASRPSVLVIEDAEHVVASLSPEPIHA